MNKYKYNIEDLVTYTDYYIKLLTDTGSLTLKDIKNLETTIYKVVDFDTTISPITSQKENYYAIIDTNSDSNSKWIEERYLKKYIKVEEAKKEVQEVKSELDLFTRKYMINVINNLIDMGFNKTNFKDILTDGFIKELK